MHGAARFQFERIVREYQRWRAVEDEERSPAAAWWWGPALTLRDAAELMPPETCRALELPLASPYASGAAVFLDAIAEQTTMPWPDHFPRVRRRGDREAAGQPTLAEAVVAPS